MPDHAATAKPTRHPLLMTICATALAIGIVIYFKISNPAIFCLIAVVYSTFIGGYLYGVLSALLAIAYCSYYFSLPGNYLAYTADNLSKMIVILIANSTMIFMVGSLKRQLQHRTQELEAINEQLRLLSTVDGLTGISNRRYFEQRLQQEWRRNLRDQTPLSLALIDIDFFKNYNDTYGHQAGDECLRQVTNTIAHRLHRPGDFAARYGGEEFAILMSDTPPAGAITVGEEIRKRIENLQIPHITSTIHSCITVSIGIITIIPTEADSLGDFIDKADIALYQAKRCGRNRLQVFAAGEDTCTYFHR